MGCLQRFEFGETGVAPQVFEVIEASGLPVKNMHHRRKIVDADPVGVLFPLDMIGHQPCLFLDPAVNIVRDTFYLGVRFALADDEEICGGLFYMPKIQLDDFFSFDVLDAVNDQII